MEHIDEHVLKIGSLRENDINKSCIYIRFINKNVPFSVIELTAFRCKFYFFLGMHFFFSLTLIVTRAVRLQVITMVSTQPGALFICREYAKLARTLVASQTSHIQPLFYTPSIPILGDFYRNCVRKSLDTLSLDTT